MPAKSKTKPEEAMLETPAGTAVASEETFRPDWPEARETRELTVSLTDDQIIEQSRVLIDNLREVENLTAAKKASADNYKSRIEEVEKRIEDVSIVVKSGKDRREVPCIWRFQCSGIDTEGAFLAHSQLKTLFREDTGEAVETKPISDEDCQMVLPLSEEESLEVNMAAITEAGYTLGETPNGSEWDAPFLLTGPDGTEYPIDADSLAEAAGVARRQLPAHAEAPAEDTGE